MLPRDHRCCPAWKSVRALGISLAWRLAGLWMELNSTPGAIDSEIEASRNAVTDGRFFVRAALMLAEAVAALQRAAETC